MISLGAALLVAAALLQDPGPSRPSIERKQAKGEGLTVHFLTIPWGPNTFAAMEEGGESFYATRTWPFARLQTTVPFAVDETTVPPGNYALVFHPNTPDKQGMSLEVRRIAVEEFLVPGNVMTPTPQGEEVARTPAVFETLAEGALVLDVGLSTREGGASLVIRYGNRRLVKDLRRVPAR